MPPSPADTAGTDRAAHPSAAVRGCLGGVCATCALTPLSTVSPSHVRTDRIEPACAVALPRPFFTLGVPLCWRRLAAVAPVSLAITASASLRARIEEAWRCSDYVVAEEVNTRMITVELVSGHVL